MPTINEVLFNISELFDIVYYHPLNSEIFIKDLIIVIECLIILLFHANLFVNTKYIFEIGKNKFDIQWLH